MSIRVIAASPDGILNDDTVIEIKCPMNEKLQKNMFRTTKSLLSISHKCNGR